MPQCDSFTVIHDQSIDVICNFSFISPRAIRQTDGTSTVTLQNRVFLPQSGARTPVQVPRNSLTI